MPQVVAVGGSEGFWRAGEDPFDAGEERGEEERGTVLAFEDLAMEGCCAAAAAVQEDDGVGVRGGWEDGLWVGVVV